MENLSVERGGKGAAAEAHVRNESNPGDDARLKFRKGRFCVIDFIS